MQYETLTSFSVSFNFEANILAWIRPRGKTFGLHCRIGSKPRPESRSRGQRCEARPRSRPNRDQKIGLNSALKPNFWPRPQPHGRGQSFGLGWGQNVETEDIITRPRPRSRYFGFKLGVEVNVCSAQKCHVLNCQREITQSYLPPTRLYTNTVIRPAFNPQQQSITALRLVFIIRLAEGRRLSWPGWTVTYRGGMPARRCSPIPILTGQPLTSLVSLAPLPLSQTAATISKSAACRRNNEECCQSIQWRFWVPV